MSEEKPGMTAAQIAQSAWDRGHVPVFATALFELLMCADPSPPRH